MNKQKPCPYCGAGVDRRSPFEMCKLKDGDYVMNHFCKGFPLGDIGVSISVYGRTEEEVVDRWNRRASDEKDMQNL